MRSDNDAVSGQFAFVRKLVPILIALIVAFVFSTSSVSISHELHHDCTGDGCAICAEMASGLHLVRDGFSMPGAVAALPIVFPFIAFLLFGLIRRSMRLMTLVALKVQLND